jgi:hypothetical protein
MQNRHTGYLQESLKQNPGLEAFEKGRGNKDGLRGPDAALPTESFYILGYLLELIIKIWRFEKKILQNLANLGQFFHEKILCAGRNHIFQVEIWRKFASQRNTGT